MRRKQHQYRVAVRLMIAVVGLNLFAGCANPPTAPEEPAMFAADSDAATFQSIGMDPLIQQAGPLSAWDPEPDPFTRNESLRNQGMGNHYSETFISVEQGGTLEFFNGNLMVLPRALSADTTIWARIFRLNRHGFFKRIYEFGPSGTTFDPDAMLTLYYGDLGPLMPNSLELKVYNESTGRWDVAGHMINHPESRSFVGPIEHFSRYSLSGNGQVLAPEIEED